MLDHIINTTAVFLESMPKNKRKKKGQFFTSKETAEFMADLFDYNCFDETVSVLDPGAGTGVLTAAFADRAIRSGRINRLSITCYENDSEVLPVLRQNLEYIKANAGINVEYSVIEDDYLLSQANDFEGNLLQSEKSPKYDAVIGNPPYLKIMRDNQTAQSMPTVVHGAPNLYFLFASMSLFNLKDGGDMVYIIPRSWTSGEYFKAFRFYLFKYGRLQHIHLFVSRDKVFSQEQVLQETIILKIRKTNLENDSVVITSSQSNNDFNDITSIKVPYDSVVTGKSKYVFLPTNETEIDTIKKINHYSKTFPEVGYRMRTGIVVDFRQRDELRAKPGKHIVPLFYSQHIKDGRVNHEESGKEADWIVDSKIGLIQPNENYVFCKRFTAKEERRRLQCGVYLCDDYKEYNYIGTQNKINYVNRMDKKPLDVDEVYGIYALLNSTLFDQYYRILNGSTQVNSTEVNSIPVPSEDVIRRIGARVHNTGELSTEVCDRIVMEEGYHE